MEVRENYINGQYVKSKSQSFFDSVNPRTGDVIGRHPRTTQREVSNVCSIAKKQFCEWVKTSTTTRSQYFQKAAKIIGIRLKEIAKAISIETGKRLDESMEEANEVLRIASQISKKEWQTRKPKGLVAIISPYSCPLIFSSIHIIIEGNTIVLKPSEKSTLSSQIASEIYHDSGVPPGVFNVIYGNASTGSWLANNSDVDYILE